MTSDPANVYLSAIDEERFGIRVAKAPRVNADTLSLIMDFCRAKRVALLIARCLASDLKAAQAMEQEGFTLMDTLLYYTRDLKNKPIPEETGKISVRPVRPGEEKDVEAIAAQSFRGYTGHYHSDEKLDQEKCNEVYASWALRSCVSRDVADEVLVADLNNSVGGFATLRLNSPEEGQLVLFCVSPSLQGQGICRSFMIRGMEWCLSKGARRMVVSTQITNIAVQKVWIRVGFEINSAYYTFHKWFDNS